MIRLTKLADYGLVLMASIARAPMGSRHSARDLALSTRLPLPVTTKILKSLTRDGLLISQRGTHGGYLLARPAREISVADVVQALDGPIALTECSGHGEGDRCFLEGCCPTSSPWQRINRTILDALKRMTLEEMAQPDRAVGATGGSAVPPAELAAGHA